MFMYIYIFVFVCLCPLFTFYFCVFLFMFIYVSSIRLLVISFSICTICGIDKQQDDYEFLNEADSFKYELIQHQDSLINYQRTMIDELANQEALLFFQ